MSYILDALKKAEQERKQGDIPDLDSSVAVKTQYASKSSVPLLLIVVMLIVVAFAWFKPWQSPITAKQPDQLTQLSQPVVAIQQAETKQPEPIQKVVKPIESIRDTPPVEIVETVEPSPNESEILEAVVAEPAAITNIMDLPSYIRNGLPSIQISGHIYDETPASRMVVINGQVEREGRYVSDRLILEEITQDGIVLNFDGTLFSMTTFDSWSR
jgi:general secretion pathway protein B